MDSNFIFQQIQARRWVEVEGGSLEKQCLPHGGPLPRSQRQFSKTEHPQSGRKEST